MKLSYIFHSGFVLETEQSILVFDYWMDPSGVMDSVLRSEKPMYVFSSHFHEDHFTKEIFEWKKQKPEQLVCQVFVRRQSRSGAIQL